MPLTTLSPPRGEWRATLPWGTQGGGKVQRIIREDILNENKYLARFFRFISLPLAVYIILPEGGGQGDLAPGEGRGQYGPALDQGKHGPSAFPNALRDCGHIYVIPYFYLEVKMTTIKVRTTSKCFTLLFLVL